MPEQAKFLDWAAVASAALNGLSSMASASESRSAAQEDWASRLEQTRMQIAGQTMLGQQARNYQLEDRAWTREQARNYIPDSEGNLRTPAPIVTQASTPVVPADLQMASQKPPEVKKPKKKKKGFLSRLFG